MKICIWCLRSEDKAFFDKIAHTIPQSLGGIHTCENICDECNAYFGNTPNRSVSPEVALKEVLNFSRHFLLTDISDNKFRLSRFKSIFFDANFTKRKYTLKLKYQLKPGFQKMLARQFKRGIYKIYLEERERQIGDARDERFNFIREFARYDLLEYPVYIQNPYLPAIPISSPDVFAPTIRFTEDTTQLDKEFRIYTYMLCGHNFIIPTTRFYEFGINKYNKHLKDSKHPFGRSMREIIYLEDIDYTFNFLYVHNEKNRTNGLKSIKIN